MNYDETVERVIAKPLKVRMVCLSSKSLGDALINFIMRFPTPFILCNIAGD